MLWYEYDDLQAAISKTGYIYVNVQSKITLIKVVTSWFSLNWGIEIEGLIKVRQNLKNLLVCPQGYLTQYPCAHDRWYEYFCYKVFVLNHSPLMMYGNLITKCILS